MDNETLAKHWFTTSLKGNAHSATGGCKNSGQKNQLTKQHKHMQMNERLERYRLQLLQRNLRLLPTHKDYSAKLDAF